MQYFSAQDKNGDGKLNLPEFTKFFKKVLQELSKKIGK